MEFDPLDELDANVTAEATTVVDSRATATDDSEASTRLTLRRTVGDAKQRCDAEGDADTEPQSTLAPKPPGCGREAARDTLPAQ